MFQDEVYKIETYVSNFLSNKMLNLFQTQAKQKKTWNDLVVTKPKKSVIKPREMCC